MCSAIFPNPYKWSTFSICLIGAFVTAYQTCGVSKGITMATTIVPETSAHYQEKSVNLKL